MIKCQLLSTTISEAVDHDCVVKKRLRAFRGRGVEAGHRPNTTKAAGDREGALDDGDLPEYSRGGTSKFSPVSEGPTSRAGGPQADDTDRSDVQRIIVIVITKRLQRLSDHCQILEM